MTTKKLTDNVKLIQVQIELDLNNPTASSRAGVGIWRGEAILEDGFRIYFQVYAPAPEKPKAQGLKIVAK